MPDEFVPLHLNETNATNSFTVFLFLFCFAYGFMEEAFTGTSHDCILNDLFFLGGG